jgi:hypothetical protein
MVKQIQLPQLFSKNIMESCVLKVTSVLLVRHRLYPAPEVSTALMKVSDRVKNANFALQELTTTFKELLDVNLAENSLLPKKELPSASALEDSEVTQQ